MERTRPDILIIDDEVRIRQLLADYLDDLDEFDVRVADSGEAGLDMLGAKKADLCIVDMRLPGMSGEEFAHTANCLGLCPHFLLHTGSMDFSLSERLQAMGMTQHDVFLKPSEAGDILERIRAVLGTDGG